MARKKTAAPGPDLREEVVKLALELDLTALADIAGAGAIAGWLLPWLLMGAMARLGARLSRRLLAEVEDGLVPALQLRGLVRLPCLQPSQPAFEFVVHFCLRQKSGCCRSWMRMGIYAATGGTVTTRSSRKDGLVKPGPAGLQTTRVPPGRARSTL